mmetsp:Transcript_69587/g.225193  ORF Transcript_69587/g.225193 Transcript_69587/m.225193 type:complete len:237 (+) Transcript_69587:285-995(+)
MQGRGLLPHRAGRSGQGGVQSRLLRRPRGAGVAEGQEVGAEPGLRLLPGVRRRRRVPGLAGLRDGRARPAGAPDVPPRHAVAADSRAPRPGHGEGHGLPGAEGPAERLRRHHGRVHEDGRPDAARLRRHRGEGAQRHDLRLRALRPRPPALRQRRGLARGARGPALGPRRLGLRPERGRAAPHPRPQARGRHRAAPHRGLRRLRGQAARLHPGVALRGPQPVEELRRHDGARRGRV